MASTRTPLEALEFAKDYTGNASIDSADVKIQILNNASNRMWMFAPWSWSIGQLDQKTLVEDTQDYTITDPGDVLYLVRAEVRKSSQNNQASNLEIVHSLANQASAKGDPRSVALTSATNLRLHPVPSGISASDPGILYSWYKKDNVEIVETGATGNQANDDNAGALLFPDEWFWVYQELVLYYAMKYRNDSRAGSVALASNRNGMEHRYNGQLAEAMDALTQMAGKEKLFRLINGEPVNG